jgi:hypothetical protein
MAKKNKVNFRMFKAIAELRGRGVAAGDEYRELIGLPQRGDSAPANARE